MSPETGRLDEDVLAALLASDPDAAVTLLADLARATDRDLRAAAQRLAARVFFRLGRAGQRAPRGTRRLGASRAEGDLDLDKTLDRWTPLWPPEPGDLVTRAWQSHRRALCLVIDCSGSMSGLAVAIAGVAAASVLLAADGRLAPGIVTFSGDVSVLPVPREPAGSRRGSRRRPGGAARAKRDDRSGGRAPAARPRPSWPAWPPTSGWRCCCLTACRLRAAIRRWH